MITTINGLVSGPYKPGQEDKFKTDVLKVWESRNDGWEHMRIETEETEPGFPDVAGFSVNCYALTEFKVSDAKGVIEFQKSQPLFYKKHFKLRINILAWDVPGNRAILISPQEILAAKTLRFKIPTGERKSERKNFADN
jgi:hypothetical protein